MQSESLAFEQFVLAAIVLGMCVAYIFFLLTLQKALRIISPAYRKTSPRNVWTLFIPIAGAVMLMVIANDLANGFKKEFDRYAVFKQGKPTFGLGLTLGILVCCYYVCNFLGGYLITGLLSIGIIAIWIAYWVQVSKIKNELITLKTTFNLEPGEQSIFV